MNWKKCWVLTCVLAWSAALYAPAEVWQAGMTEEVTLDKPPLVALTFDDGPRADTTGLLLDGLALREVPATFFLVGSRIRGNGALIQRMAAGGHQIGIHTYDHVQITDLSHKDFDLQVSRTKALLTELLHENEFWLRPPYGIMDAKTAQWCDCPLVLWSVDPEDWKDHDAERIISAVLDQVEDGDIILMHDIYHSSVDAALQIVDALTDRGYVFVTVEQLMALREVEPEKGKRCYACPP